ncbi:TRAP transporter small permease subunit [Thermanaerosceptrum fracticalcis]|uniref:TRAP transporter small permease subunit n=1 Tax=Thermanaerosceptrum fracticalcis TaxID=1712410 RepID=A0A7G6E2P1_THEFR|nr:TRAP transporter small permease [Thermanaerosceptrum fracticalcis]QNB46345.1 TRAP transporter small permease subunit [Thermanaerosceptrum fracticalcis]
MDLRKGLVAKLEEKIIGILMAIALVVGFMQVAARFVFKSSLPWSEELLRFVFEWVTFLAASIAVREKAHVSVSVVVEKLPKPIRRGVGVMGILLSIGFCLAITYYGLQLVKVQFETNQISTAMELPMWIPYLGLVVGSLMMAIRFIQNLFSVIIRNRQNSAMEIKNC